jgi:hypothetical protein
MAELLLQHLECVGRLLERLEGPEREQTASVQATAFAAMLAKLQTMPPSGTAVVKAAIGESGFTDEAKRSFMEVLDSKTKPRKRPMQDYGAWPSFGTQALWQQIAASPELSLELITQHLHALGLINPDKGTQKSIAAHVACAETAALRGGFLVSPVEANDRFKSVGKRLKQLYSRREPVEYIKQLPATPALLVRMHPSTARAVYSRENLPCACPLEPFRVAAVESMICCRRDDKSSASSAAEVSMQQMMSAMLGQFTTLMKMAAPQQAAKPELELFPPGTLGAAKQLGAWQNSHPKLAALADASRGPATPVTPPPRPNAYSPVADVGGGGCKAAVGEGAKPRCLAILDTDKEKDDKEEDEPPARTAAAMRKAIVMKRAALIADRAKKAADAKAANNCGDNRFTFL